MAIIAKCGQKGVPSTSHTIRTSSESKADWTSVDISANPGQYAQKTATIESRQVYRAKPNIFPDPFFALVVLQLSGSSLEVNSLST